ncbi:MAG: OmpA family protein [Steroidobacteraceae bacterium]
MKISAAPGAVAMAVCAALASHMAAAQDTGWYLGINAGQARATINDDDIVSGLQGAGFATNFIADDNDHFAYKAFAGYDFSRYFAMEGGYFDPGRFGYLAGTTPPGSLRGNMRLNGVNLDALAFLPMGDRFSLFGRVGANYAEVRDAFVGSGSVNVLTPDRSERNLNYKFGAGMQWLFTPSFAMRAEAERYRIDDPTDRKADIDMFSIGLLYRFGRHVAAPVAVARTPPPAPPAAVAPPAPPPPAPAPEAPRTQRYCSVLDLHFEINKAAVEREDLEKLKVAGTFLQTYPSNTAVIAGYTDDVGSEEANMLLSKRRADNVAAYLLRTFRIGPQQLTAVGYGESRPVADNRTEAGRRQNRRIETVIECASDVAGLSVKEARLTMALLIEFDQNSADVKSQYNAQLREVADFLKANPAVTATVEGHTGNLQATPQLSEEMSLRRAQNVVTYLVENFGVARSRLTAAGFGNTRQFSYNTTLQGQQDNRRVNIIFNYPK